MADKNTQRSPTTYDTRPMPPLPPPPPPPPAPAPPSPTHRDALPQATTTHAPPRRLSTAPPQAVHTQSPHSTIGSAPRRRSPPHLVVLGLTRPYCGRTLTTLKTRRYRSPSAPLPHADPTPLSPPSTKETHRWHAPRPPSRRRPSTPTATVTRPPRRATAKETAPRRAAITSCAPGRRGPGQG